jgi:hypothetical protein
MRWLLSLGLLLCCTLSQAQEDSTDLVALSKMTFLSEVVIRSDLNTIRLLRRVKEDTTFYKAFRTLHIIGFTSINDIKMLDKNGKVDASLYSKTRQNREGNCRTMDVLEQRTTGDMLRHGKLNYFTAELYSGLFFTNGKVCGENNTVAGIERNVRDKSGLDKRKEQLKMMFFNPGKKIPGIPFIGDKLDIFDTDNRQYYNFSVDMGEMNGQNCYIFKIARRDDLSSWEKGHVVFDNITTWFNQKTMEIVGRTYDLSYDTPVYDFDVHMEVEMTRFHGMLVPQVLRYKGNWKVAFKSRERAIFTATLSDFR